MSTSSRSVARSAAALALASFLAMSDARAADASKAPPLPDAVSALSPQARVQGGGELRFLGLTVYDGFFWSPSRGYSLDLPFALDLHYKRPLQGGKIAERSVDEIAKLGLGTPEQRTRWGAAMKAIFPDVGKGDRLTGVNLPGAGARFFHNGKPIGEVTDPAFAQAFFGIWFDPKTSRPDFRKRLLGES
jgi:Chalcone isomerase-like